MKHPFLASGFSGALYLGGAVPAIFVILVAGQQFAPHSETLAGLMALALVVGGLSLGGALWGRSVARRLGWANTRGVMAATGAAYCVVMIAAMQALGTLERVLVEQGRTGGVPLHVLFAILFTAATFVVVAVLGLVIGGLAKGWRLALKLALAAGTASALAFLLADVVQDLLGRRVGGPHAAETFTMISVAFIGNIVASFIGGGVMGWMLTAERQAQPAVSQGHTIPELGTP